MAKAESSLLSQETFSTSCDQEISIPSVRIHIFSQPALLKILLMNAEEKKEILSTYKWVKVKPYQMNELLP